MIAPTQACVVREECQKAEWQHGFRRLVGESDGWAVVESTTAQGTIWPAAESAQCLWILELDHPGVAAELALSFPDNPGSGIARHSFSTLTTLNAVLPCVYQLAASTPDRTAQDFPPANRQASTDKGTLIEVIADEHD